MKSKELSFKTIDFNFKAKDGTKIFANKWTKEDAKPKAVIQIAHGMAEHVLRYEEFAKVLVEEDFIVYGNDHRGHGRTAGSLDNIGYFADEYGWDLVTEDMKELTNIIRDENHDIPIFLLGHSMGSFLSRTYIQRYGEEINGVILSGTGGSSGILGDVGIFIAKREIKKNSKRAKSEKLNKLSFGGFNKAFAPNRTEFDWLSRDYISVDKYIEDPLCGDVFTAGFFYDMLIGLKDLNNKQNINRTPKNLPILLISGEKDPVGKNTKGVLQVYKSYEKAGIKDITYKFYKDARHEILNEINKEEIYTDIINWLNEHI